MVKYSCVFFICLLFVLANDINAQNSVLVNFGKSSCTPGGSPASFGLIKNPLTGTPQLIADCDFSQQQPNYNAVYIAYNPKENKVYIADTRDDIQTKIWVLDIGLPANLQCPAAITTAPGYSYNYVASNFEFDNNGDLWSLSNGGNVSITGLCNIDKFDVSNGNILGSKPLQFSAGNFPSTVESGDLTILPNGRMFAVLGYPVSNLYEITNYNTTGGTASATFLAAIPQPCFGIAYLNGLLELTGTDQANSCYYYTYNIAGGTLSTINAFQNGLAPIDNSSITPSTGCTKRLLNAVKINSNTADLVYEIYTENLGNVILNNINVADNLAMPYGAANVSNVSVSFVPGSNAANLVLNPAYNGTTNTSILNPGQNLPNKVLANRDYFFKVQVRCRVTNLNNVVTYLNSAVASANIGAGSAVSTVAVSDSSNNGDTTLADPNKNGNASDAGENVPTPFSFGALPVRFINAGAILVNQKTALISWQVAVPMENASTFEIEFSIDGRNWGRAGVLAIDNLKNANWQFTHNNIPAGNLYYRIKQTDKDGSFAYSRIALLKNKTGQGYVVYPNPANNFIAVSSGSNVSANTTIQLFDATGRLVANKLMQNSNEEISTAALPPGTYLLKVINTDEAKAFKVLVQH